MINNKTFLTTIELIPNPAILTSGKKLLQSNKAFLDFFNYKTTEEFAKYNSCICNLFIKYENYFSLDQIDENTLWTDYIYNNNKVIILNKHLEPRTFKVSVAHLEEYGDYYLVIFTDITTTINRKKLLERMAYHDPLTSVYNRQMFIELLIKERENKKRHGDVLSLIMFDIDHFKEVNDSYGHNIGDKVLITLTQLVSKHLRASDIFARLGGDEFMILLPRTNPDVAYNKAQELRTIVEKYLDNTIPQITASFGVTEIRGDDKDQSCLKRVDKALYQAKDERSSVIKI